MVIVWDLVRLPGERKEQAPDAKRPRRRKERLVLLVWHACDDELKPEIADLQARMKAGRNAGISDGSNCCA